MTSEELYDYIHDLIVGIKEKYRGVDVCEFGEDKICANKNNNRQPGEGCCCGCIYHSMFGGCEFPGVNLTCMAVYCESVTLLEENDKRKLKLIETLLKMLGVEPRITYEEQIMIMDNFGNRMNTSKEPLRDVYNLFKLFDF